MFENSSIPYTIIKDIPSKNVDEPFQWKSVLSESSLIFEIKNIHLNQEPNETFDMRISVSKLKRKNCSYKEIVLLGTNDSSYSVSSPDHCIEHTVYDETMKKNSSILICQFTYTAELKFDNFIHEFKKNYFYEVVCKLPAGENALVDKHFFRFVEPRLGSTIITGKEVALVTGTTGKDITFKTGITNLRCLRKAYFCLRRHRAGDSDESYNLISALRNIGCDVILKAKDDQVLAHKSVLSKKSLVFEHMFTHEMKEKQDGIVNMPDFEANVISKMLDFLYTNQLHDISGMEQQLFKLAHLYQFHELSLHCIECCIFNVKPNNGHIVDILELANQYDLGELERSAVGFVQCHENDLRQVSSYQQYLSQSLNQENVIRILTLAHKNNMFDVKMSALNFIRANYQELIEKDAFTDLFDFNPSLMKEVFNYSNKKQKI